MKEQQMLDIVSLLNKKFQYISGKLFMGNKEIKNPVNYLYKTIYNAGYPILERDLKTIIDTLKINDTLGTWPELPIVTKARELGAITENNTILDDKQLQILNILLYHPKEPALFITTGIAGSGKSTFLNIVRQLFDNDCATCSLSDLSSEFNLAEAIKHRLICSDEIDGKDLDLNAIKILANKQEINANGKFQTPKNVKTQSALFYCCNMAPRINAQDTGILRRIIFYERNQKIQKPNLELYDKVYTEDELIEIARIALSYENPSWRELFKKETRKYIMKDNSVYLCWSFEYSNYVERCKEKGLKPFSEPKWSEIRELFASWNEEEANDKLREELF